MARPDPEPSSTATFQPMRICLFSYGFLPRVGGMEQAAMSLAQGWVAGGHEVTLVTVTPPPEGQSSEAYDGQFPFTVIRLPGGAAGRRAWGPILARSDVVVSNGMSVTFLPSWIRRRARVVYVHQTFLGIRPFEHPAPLLEQARRWSRLTWRRAVLRRAAGNVYISRFIRDRVGVPGGRVIYNPVDPAFRPLNVPRRGDIAFFGRMVPEKGVSTLLDALRLCNDRGHRFTLDLYGEGTHLADFRSMAEQVQLGDGQVRWHGFLRGEPLVSAMNAASVVVIPSLWDEPMGIVAIEAMACGRCVIGSAGGGLGEVLEGVCPTFPNGDATALADRLVTVLTDPAARASHERAARRRSGDFSLPRVSGQYVEYLTDILTPSGRRA